MSREKVLGEKEEGTISQVSVAEIRSFCLVFTLVINSETQLLG